MPPAPLACPPQPHSPRGGHWPQVVATVPSPGPASPLSPAPPLPGGVLPDLRYDHRRVRPPGPVEEERAEEAGPALLNAVHYKYIHTYKYIHRKISILQLCMILGAVCGRGALCTPESELESRRSFYALCFLFFSNTVSVCTLGFSQGLKPCGSQSNLVSVTAAPEGRIFMEQPQRAGLGGKGALGWDGSILSPSAQLVRVFTYGMENVLGTFVGKRDRTMGSLLPSQPLTWPCTGDTFSFTLRVRNTELGAGDKRWGPRGEQGAAPWVEVPA